MNNTDEISLTPEYSSTLKNYEMLRESLLQTEVEKKYLLHQALPELQAIYLSKVGKLKLELLESPCPAARQCRPTPSWWCQGRCRCSCSLEVFMQGTYSTSISAGVRIGPGVAPFETTGRSTFSAFHPL